MTSNMAAWKCPKMKKVRFRKTFPWTEHVAHGVNKNDTFNWKKYKFLPTAILVLYLTNIVNKIVKVMQKLCESKKYT